MCFILCTFACLALDLIFFQVWALSMARPYLVQTTGAAPFMGLIYSVLAVVYLVVGVLCWAVKRPPDTAAILLAFSSAPIFVLTIVRAGLLPILVPALALAAVGTLGIHHAGRLWSEERRRRVRGRGGRHRRVGPEG
ncbi:MAG: hypothetical protein HY722_01110 [Planctomycetes bacterium]|nr:hypothetical protein [Planctomycetota bacterium]